MKPIDSKSPRQRYILYLDRASLAFFSKTGQKLCNLDLGPEILKDMELLSPELFLQSLSLFMDTNKISACDVVVVLGENTYFEHVMQSLAGDEASNKDMETFLDTVPFEQSVKRVLTEDVSKRAVVLNHDYCDLLLEFLEKRCIRVLGLFPLSLLKLKAPEELKLDQFIKNLDDYKKVNFLTDFERKVNPDSFITRNSPKNTRNLKIMAGLFILLLVILGAAIYFSLIRKG